jgi:hypothetical protein
MGIDAQMFVRIPRLVSDEDVKQWSYRFGSMCHYELFLGHGTTRYHKPLERIAVYSQDGPDIKPKVGETFLELHLNGRYYGEDYERGPLLTFIAMAEFLEILIPQCAVWYGGDSSGVCAEPFDKTRRDALLRHAAKVAHEPYTHYDRSILQGDAHAPSEMCPSCEMPAARCGWGGNPPFALYRCDGCGWQIEYRGTVRREGFTIPEKAEAAS